MADNKRPIAVGRAAEEEEDRRTDRYRRTQERARNVTLYMPSDAYARLDGFTRKFIGDHARTSISEVAQQAIRLVLDKYPEELEQRLVEIVARSRGRG